MSGIKYLGPVIEATPRCCSVQSRGGEKLKGSVPKFERPSLIECPRESCPSGSSPPNGMQASFSEHLLTSKSLESRALVCWSLGERTCRAAGPELRTCPAGSRSPRFRVEVTLRALPFLLNSSREATESAPSPRRAQLSKHFFHASCTR